MAAEIITTTNTPTAITAATANFHVQLYDFPHGTRIQGAHIHSGVAGVNGPVRIDTGFSASNTHTLTDGTATLNLIGVVADPTIVQAIIDNPSGWYFNVHSPLNPGGFTRGQLVRVQ